jgi:7-keto-8-aminopelargonate synthetase-like enzyme
MTTSTTARIFSFALAALITASTLAAIDTLAHHQHAATDLVAQTAAARPA